MFIDINLNQAKLPAVHAYGMVMEHDEETLLESLRRQINRHEQESEEPISLESLPKSVVEPQLKSIYGFEISIDKVKANFKLSQNRNNRDYAVIIKRLEETKDPQRQGIARCIRELKKSENFSKSRKLQLV